MTLEQIKAHQRMEQARKEFRLARMSLRLAAYQFERQLYKQDRPALLRRQAG